MESTGDWKTHSVICNYVRFDLNLLALIEKHNVTSKSVSIAFYVILFSFEIDFFLFLISDLFCDSGLLF